MTTKEIKENKCNATIDFADDFGDNPCTFHCNLPLNHKGRHRETGDMYGKKYKLEWESIPRSIEEIEYIDKSISIDQYMDLNPDLEP